MAPVLVEQPEPVIKRKTGLVGRTVTSELVALCPKCKTLETLWFNRDGLIQTRRFYQEDGKVYHDCGSSEPCRLYRTWQNISLGR